MSRSSPVFVVSAHEESATKKQILHTAADQFALYGFNGVSLREILRIAGVNVASGHYYFKSKAHVYFAVVAQTLMTVNTHRLSLLRDFEARSDRKLPMLVAAYVVPHLRASCTLGKQGSNYADIMARLGYEPADVLKSVFKTLIAPTRVRFANALRDMFPALDDERLARGIAVVIAIMATSATNFTHHIPRRKLLNPALSRELENETVSAGVAALLAMFHADPRESTHAAL